MEECVDYAVGHNLSVQQYELDLQNAAIDKSDALGAMLPDLNASASASGNTGLILNPTTNGFVSGTIGSVSGSVTSSMTLFDGLRNVHRLNRAKLNGIASQYRIDGLKDDIRLSVANAYLQILSNKESLKVFEAQYAATAQDMERTKELVEAGVVPKGDLLEVEATAAGQQQQIVNARNAVLISRINLAQMLQLTDYTEFDIAEEQFEVPPSDILNYSPKDIFAKALTFRNDIKFSESNVLLAEKDLQIAKGAIYPSIGAFFNYNTRYSDQTRDAITGEKIAFNDQLWLNDGISFGAQLNVPVFNGFSVRNNIRRSQISMKKSQLDLEQAKLDLESDINQAYADVQNNAASFEAAQKTLDARRTAFEYARERREVGLMNAFEYSQSLARVDNAEAELIRAKYDYIFRLKVLEFYFGLPVRLD